MSTTRSTDRVRYRYGICLNDNCEKCKIKEIQEIPARKEFVCQNPECGKPLRECPSPKKGGKGKLIGIIAGVVALLAIIIGVVVLGRGGEKTTAPVPDSVAVSPVDSDSIKAAQMEAEHQRLKDSRAAVAEVADAEKKDDNPTELQKAPEKPIATPASVSKPAATGGTKKLGYATFKGSWPNDVNGRMVFKSSHVIDSRDPKGRVAEPGDYVIGEWADGHLVQGIWYGSDNQVKGSVIIGR